MLKKILFSAMLLTLLIGQSALAQVGENTYQLDIVGDIRNADGIPRAFVVVGLMTESSQYTEVQADSKGHFEIHGFVVHSGRGTLQVKSVDGNVVLDSMPLNWQGDAGEKQFKLQITTGKDEMYAEPGSIFPQVIEATAPPPVVKTPAPAVNQPSAASVNDSDNTASNNTSLIVLGAGLLCGGLLIGALMVGGVLWFTKGRS